MNGAWPLLAFAALGAYHGINPGMGWLFAVALGLQERSRRAVLLALPPIALGHAASIAAVVALLRMTQTIVPARTVHIAVAAVILAFGTVRLLRLWHPRWVGMRVGARDLTIWSFVMSSAHGAGLMLVPVLLACHPAGLSFAAQFPPAASAPAIATASHTSHFPLSSGPGLLLAAVGVHTLSLLLVGGVIAIVVYEKMGVAFLRRAWVNLDLVWTLALIVSGAAALVF